MRARKIDDNQQHIVAQLRRCGYSVAITSQLGAGFPDIVVGAAKRNYLFEIKDPNKPPSKRKLTPQEEEWHSSWRGQVNVIESWEQANEIIEKG